MVHTLKIFFLFLLASFSVAAQRDGSSQVLLAVLDASNGMPITSLDSIKVFSADQRFTLRNPKAKLNFRIDSLIPPGLAGCLITVFRSSYEPAGYKARLRPGKTTRFTIELKRIPEFSVVDPATVYRAVPAFPGGSGKLNCFLNDNLDLEIVSADFLQPGEVKIRLTVPPDGSVTDIVFEDTYPLEHINAEILNVLTIMPPWDPAVEDRMRISKEFKFSIKIPYQIQKCNP